MKTTNPRLIAMHILQAVLYQGQSLDKALLALKLPAQTASYIRALCFGVIRYYYRLTAIASLLLSKPLKTKDQDLYLLLLGGIYELLYMHTPAHAAISETVNAIRTNGKIWATGLANAVLRNLQRKQASLLTQLDADPSAYYMHPEWFIHRLKKAWPAHWQMILEANNQTPPMSLRVNQQQSSREQYLNQLHTLNIHAHTIPYTNHGLTLNQPIAVDELPSFASGTVTVQDGAAQLAAELLELAPEQRVLDACAAPGGKTGHILEITPNLKELVAVDINAERLQRVQENLNRLQLTATLKAVDVGQTQQWWDRQYFDRILLDAPCSGTGVIRRHPDIKLLRRPSDIQALAAQQLHLLTQLWPLLAPEGILVYSTCSIMPEENLQIISQFLAKQKDAQEKRIDSAWGLPLAHGRQILPSTNGMDGFYYAKLQKIAI